MSNLSKIPTISAAFAAALALAGCGERDPGETRVAVIGGVEAAERIVDAATAQGLVALDATGDIRPALAESWHVSDDGKSYIFRLGDARAGGDKVNAQQVARDLKRLIDAAPLFEALDGVEDVVAMTDRVLEIRLAAPRPNILFLLASPELSIRIDDAGTGPFTLAAADEAEDADGARHLVRDRVDRFGDSHGREQVHVEVESARDAIKAFVAGDVELVLGGTFDALPLVREAAIPRGSLRYDPVAGLFGLVPLRNQGVAGDPEARRLLSRAIDRQALLDAIEVPALTPRATILQAGTDLRAPPVQPDWLANAAARQAVPLRFAALYPDRGDDLVVGVVLPDGPGGEILLGRLRSDWGALGIDVQRTDLATADFALVDEAAPSPGAAWFVRRFTCKLAKVCDEDIDALVDAARIAPLVDQRRAILAEAGTRMDDAALFIPLAAPVRWSLVAPSIVGYGENAFGQHVLTDLKRPLQTEASR